MRLPRKLKKRTPKLVRPFVMFSHQMKLTTRQFVYFGDAFALVAESIIAQAEYAEVLNEEGETNG